MIWQTRLMLFCLFLSKMISRFGLTLNLNNQAITIAVTPEIMDETRIVPISRLSNINVQRCYAFIISL